MVEFENLIIGKLYKSGWDGDYKQKFIFRFTGYNILINNKYIKCSYYIHQNKYYGKGSNCFMAKNHIYLPNTFKEIQIKDIIEHLPIKHPDKISYLRKKKIKTLLLALTRAKATHLTI